MIIINEVYEAKTIEAICKYMIMGYAVLIKTDTQWGLMAINPSIIYEIKQRPLDKKIIKLVGTNFKFGHLTEPQKMFIRRFWPGPVTIVLDGESYRLTSRKYINTIINHLGTYVYCSSANISGGDPITSMDEAVTIFANSVDKIIMVAPVRETDKVEPNVLPSTIVDIDYWYIIRKGQKYLEVVNYIANRIIPYIKQKKEEINKVDERLLYKPEIKEKTPYDGIPVLDFIPGLSKTIRKERTKNKSKKTDNNDKSKSKR